MGRVELVEIEVGSGGGVYCVVSGDSVMVSLVLTEMKKKTTYSSQAEEPRYFRTKQTLNIII